VNELETLAELGVALDPPDPNPPAALFHRVNDGRRAHPVPRVRRRLVWPAASVGAVAAAAVAVVLLTGSPATVTSHAPQGLSTVTGAPLDAVRVLTLAAEQTKTHADLTAKPDQFVFVESVKRYELIDPVTPRTSFLTRFEQQWLSADGTHTGQYRDRPWPGNGAWTSGPVAACSDGELTGGEVSASKPCTPTPAYLASLPTGADAMRAYLYRAGRSPDDAAFTTAQNVLSASWLRPQVQAAVFAAVARIPGVTVDEHATDLTGRKAIEVSRGSGLLRAGLLFDPTTYAFLGLANAVDHLPTFKSTQPGFQLSVLAGTAVLRTAVVDRPGQQP
jgi:hypothetical protein